MGYSATSGEWDLPVSDQGSTLAPALGAANHAKLRSHILGRHVRAAAHACGACGARFAWHSCLSRHVRQKHAGRFTQGQCLSAVLTPKTDAYYLQEVSISAVLEDISFGVHTFEKKWIDRDKTGGSALLLNQLRTELRCDEAWSPYNRAAVTDLGIYTASVALARMVGERTDAENIEARILKSNHAKLRSHILGRHVRAAAHACGACGARFAWHSCLSRHVRQKHAGTRD
ncbi:uncharacterized protein LOC124542112 [Vanessa cardui]|uniref:uncharacterized protein LOC124542112 n=1 Tax=Vanessa cardui TaxID=171605 RepID=UPI001F142020|nr:uncharacterized protein LOC124542112 [Vanessa cardui]